MEYQNIKNLLDNTSNQRSNYRTTNFVKTDDESVGTYNTNSHIKFKASLPKSSLCDYRNVNPNNNGKEVVFKNCASFTDFISEINNTQENNAKDNDVVMTMYNLIECSDNYSKTLGSLT